MDLKEAIRDRFGGALYRIHFFIMLRVEMAEGPDVYKDLNDDFETLDGVWMKYNHWRDCDFAIRIRDTAVCSLRLKQQAQANTALPMSPDLIRLLDESDCGRGCVCQLGALEPNHVDVFEQSPDHAVSVDSHKEHSTRQRFLRNLHERGL